MKMTWVYACAASLLTACGARTGLGDVANDVAGDGAVPDAGSAFNDASAGDALDADADVVVIDEGLPGDDGLRPIDTGSLDGSLPDGTTGGGGTGGAEPFTSLCPDRAPTAGDVCVRGPYYCYYYATVAAACADSFKCMHYGPLPEEPGPTDFGGPWPACGSDEGAASCAEGKACGLVEAKGGCFVACERKCRCDEPSGTLRCQPLGC